MDVSLVDVAAFLANADTPGWLFRNGLVWGALVVFALLYRHRPRRAEPRPNRYFMGLLAGGVAAVAFEWMA
jgi:multisubunit Na+/H+ antiporter MnhB subunit